MSISINQFQGLNEGLKILAQYENLYDLFYPRDQDIHNENVSLHSNNIMVGKKRKREYKIKETFNTNKRTRHD